MTPRSGLSKLWVAVAAIIIIGIILYAALQFPMEGGETGPAETPPEEGGLPRRVVRGSPSRSSPATHPLSGS